MQTFAACPFLCSCPSFALQDQGRGQKALVAPFYLKRLRFRCALSQNKSLALKKTPSRTLLYCGNAMLQARGGLCAVFCKYSSQGLVPPQCKRCFCQEKFPQYIPKKTPTKNPQYIKKREKGRVMVCHCFASQVLVYSCHSYLKRVYI